MMELSAPSIAYSIATARPIPLSPPVITAFLPLSLPAARYGWYPPSSAGSWSLIASLGNSVCLPGMEDW